MNKYLKKLRNCVLESVAQGLTHDMALDVYKKLSRRFEIDSVSITGTSGLITGHPTDLVMGGYIANRGYCPGFVDLICKRLLKDGHGTFVDIGANIGLITIPVARNSQAVVHAFEPEPSNFRHLTQNVGANLVPERVNLHNFALAAEEGSLEFELSADNFGDHRIHRPTDIAWEKFAESRRRVIEIKGRPLDAILDPDDLPRPIIVKMDTQGAEVEVVKGGRRLFEHADYVLSEYCPYMIRRMGDDPEAFLNFVREFPFAARLNDGDTASLMVKPTEDAIGFMTEIPRDGSAARHVDVLLTRTGELPE